MTHKLRMYVFLLLLIGGGMMGGCWGERPTQIAIEGGEPPAFSFSGSGNLSAFSVYLVPPSPEKMDKPFSEQVPIWQIESATDFLHGRPIEQIKKLTYGSIPAGYKQTFPGSAESPRALEADKAYFFACNTTNAPTTAGYFLVHDGKAIPTHVETPCWGAQNDKWVAVPCPNHP